ncbi:hypothetical protein EVAR_7921_1 [Eumeta japonica]|uniref:DUF4776 domain-containing protein n=1 Tax=Eumeta variegata TaxID=151549 RepID=A0A4C1TVJ8_EUMVA|nr:hypothetical protein EVAR_7921_1 [Eumeta japonica]
MSSPPPLTEEELERRRRKKLAAKWNYSFGDVHPGNMVGHKHCNPFLKPRPGPIPANMGWLWTATNVPGMKVRRGWAPGVIGKSVAKLMTFKCPRVDKKKTKKERKSFGGDAEEEPEDEDLPPKPALMIQRKGDTYTISVNPLKNLAELEEGEDPYVDCDPLVFKIVKNRSPEERAKVEARRMAKLKKQRDAEIRKALAEAAEDICRCAYTDVYCNDPSAIDRVIEACPTFKEPDCVCKEESMSSLSSNATWDIEYTPPFGCFDLKPFKRKHFVSAETQYRLADIGIVEPEKVRSKTSAAVKKRRISRSRRYCPVPCRRVI